MGSYVTFTTFMNHCKETSITQLSIKDIRGSVFLQKRRRAAFLLSSPSSLLYPLLSSRFSLQPFGAVIFPSLCWLTQTWALNHDPDALLGFFFPGVRFTPKGCSWQHSLDKRESRDHLSDRLASSKSMMKEAFSFWTRLCKKKALFLFRYSPLGSK